MLFEEINSRTPTFSVERYIRKELTMFMFRYMQGKDTGRGAPCPHLLTCTSILFAICAAALFGAVTGRVSGTIKDPSGAVVVGATVIAVNTETGVKASTTTDAQGFYAFPALAVGHYTLEVTQQGFKEFRETGLVLDVNTALTVDVNLQLGTPTEQVTVNSAAVQVETTSTQMGEVINSAKMTTVPLNGRSYTDLLALQPGVTPVSSGQYGALNVSGDLNPGSLSVSGQRESANGFMVNGGNVEEEPIWEQR
jgi:Carboxypeptidase regulatory-like domain